MALKYQPLCEEHGVTCMDSDGYLLSNASEGAGTAMKSGDWMMHDKSALGSDNETGVRFLRTWTRLPALSDCEGVSYESLIAIADLLEQSLTRDAKPTQESPTQEGRLFVIVITPDYMASHGASTKQITSCSAGRQRSLVAML